jgi:hypothetical protein
MVTPRQWFGLIVGGAGVAMFTYLIAWHWRRFPIE